MCKDTTLPLCGIDEAGRVPLAASLVMAGVVLTKDILKELGLL